jgi:hypothetical protein
VSKPAETKTRSTAWAIETYGGITFKIDSSWKKEIDDNGSYLYFPPIAEPTGVIACTNIRQERLKGDLSDGDIRYLLDRLESFLIGSEEEIKPIGSKREISRAYLKIGDKNAIRVSYYLQEKNDTNGDERVRLDRVIVLFEDGFTSLDSLFQITGYDSYKNTIESTLSSIQLGSTAYSSSSPSSQPSVITISAPAIVKDYVDNEIAANHKYEGKNVRITAKIKDIGKDILGNPYITFSDGEEYSFRSVQCYFKKSEQAKIGTLRKEQTVTIDGTVDGLMMNVLLKDCVFKD